MPDLTPRELWHNIMHYQEFDRVPVLHWGIWTETEKRWHNEGWSEAMDIHKCLGARPMCEGVHINNGLFPNFEEETIEETDAYRIFRQGDGVIAKHWKNRSCIPQFIDFTMKDASGWGEYKKRLQPHPARIPADLDERIARAKTAGLPIRTGTGSMIGWIRDWMGVENLAYLSYDNREVLAEMVDTIANLVVWGLEQVLPRVKVDMGWGWEDICFRSGPLLSPHIFKEVVVPGYRKIAAKLLEYGVDLYVVDCDGMIDQLIPHWLEAGVNVMFPVEIGAWKTDPHALRKKFGRELRMFGGIDKLEIAKGPKYIDAEIARRVPLMKQGGYLPLPDHVIPPETSLENYKYYINRIRELRF